MISNLGFPTDIDFLDHLKNHTASAHKKLENLSVSKSILYADMKIGEYCHYLSLMYDVHKSTEDVIFPFLKDIVFDLKEREKTHLIYNDLLFLNFNKNGSSIVFENQKITTAFALGILYVIEGSSLGGRYILKNVETIQGLDQQEGISYFTGYGNKTGSYWKNFLNTLTEYQQKNKCENEIIEGAGYAFECIYNHFLNASKNEN
ncbi:biliverdin-producing heme oxygenase [Flavobacterium sp. JLP]|uniref:biliverdin-producing heme oxygenase n=1 Tax=Flavobacterium sp. JLP TaxID=2783793 RepID=UPI00188A34BA|nr:biliverdin-producing heme oxygenase [Flavobacterium sp. JLP]MBF4507756.1 biliverdin-producing heme oxygenase [Flavobacterium sp. JLP]